MQEAYVYMMADRKRGVIYLGFSTDMSRRGWEHRNKLIDGFTKKYNVIRLVWFERHQSVEKAMAMEKKLKNLHRSKKIEIIERTNPEWRDLYPEIVPYDPAQLLRNSQD
jgi:putative endonuclease